MTGAEIFEKTATRLRDLPGLPEESIQDVNALVNRYGEAQKEVDRLCSVLEDARNFFDRLVNVGALPHSDWDQMAGLMSANITRALNGRELLGRPPAAVTPTTQGKEGRL